MHCDQGVQWFDVCGGDNGDCGSGDDGADVRDDGDDGADVRDDNDDDGGDDNGGAGDDVINGEYWWDWVLSRPVITSSSMKWHEC